MQIDADKLLETALKDGLRDAVQKRFGQSYQNPLDDIMEAAITKHRPALSGMLSDAIDSFLKDGQMRMEIATAIRQALAKQLVQKFGGELEKQVNALKSDPATRARITLAIDEIVKTK